MIYQLFLNGLRATPDAAAIVLSHGERCTYASVNRKINSWANYLIALGIDNGDRVGVLLDNEDHHLFILLALDKINACYVPFDTDAPKVQLTLDCLNLGLKKFIIETTLCADFEIAPTIKVSLSNDEMVNLYPDQCEEPSRAYNHNGFDKTVYIVSSSGSTGKKKWIPILGSGLSYWAEVINNQMVLNSEDTVLATRSPAYDARIFEYVLAFSAGSSLHFLSRTQRKNVPSILTACQTAQISCLLLIASQLGSEQCERLISELKQHGLKHLMVTGDACSLLLKKFCEQSSINLWNCYGPTEATFGLSILRVTNLHPHNALGEELVPIGRPYGENVHYHLIENKLYIESPYLTPGYLDHDANDTAFKWITVSDDKKIRVFDTGDSFYEQGEFIFYQGRHHFDGHCKINGVKVSPFLVEQCIQEYRYEERTLQAAVVIKSHLGQDKPFAYLVIPDDFNKDAFVRYLQGRLKKEEFPILLRIAELPMLFPSQKIDRQQLIAREDAPERYFFSAKENASVGKENATLQAVKKIWDELFRRDNVPVDVAFIFLGGDSLMAMSMIRKINEIIDREYSYLSLLGLSQITITNVVESIHQAKKRSYKQAFIQPIVHADDRKGALFFLPALLGEGYFSYRHLAERMAKKFDQNIYGLSDPGITHEDLLPQSLEHAVQRYILAIKSIQAKGPYQLLGFSFGSTLAYEVAKQLLAEGEKVSEVHLVDGFPPYLYQSLSAKAHVDLLEALINFMIDTLNNRFYAEKLKHIKLTNFARLDKAEQIELSFSALEKKLTNPVSKNMLNIAKRHLTFSLMAPEPRDKLPIWPTFYLTDVTQKYLNVINQIPGIAKNSADYHYFFWTRYFCNLTRNGAELQCDHLSLLRAGPAMHERTAETFWQRTHDILLNLKVDHLGPHAFYRLETMDEEHTQLSIFFLIQGSLRYLVRDLKSMGLSPKVILHDKFLKMQSDTLYTSQANVFVQVPNTALRDVCTFMGKTKIKKQVSESLKGTPKEELTQGKQSGTIDLVVLWNRGPLLTLSFKYHSLPKVIIESIHQRMELIPTREFGQENKNLLYQHNIILFGVTLYNAIEHIQSFLADFISVLQPHVNELDTGMVSAATHAALP